MARTIESPGVEIKELDLTLTAGLPIGTNFLTVGFATQGPTDEILNVTSISEFEQIFGLPSTAAERYLYHTAKQILQSPGNLLVTRLPYGSGSGDGYGNDYSALVYPVVPTTTSGQVSSGSSPLSGAGTFFLGEPVHVRLTAAQYAGLTNNDSNGITWSSVAGGTSGGPGVNLGRAGMIIVNEAKTIIDDGFAGFYVGIADNTTINPATTYNAITGVASVDANDAYFQLDTSRLTFTTSAPISGAHGSTSEILESIPSYDFNSAEYNDSLILAVFKIRPSLYAADPLKLDQVLTESYVGSLNANRVTHTNTSGNAPTSFFIEEVVNRTSPNIRVYVNPNISKNIIWEGTNGLTARSVRVYTPDTAAAVSAPQRNYVANSGYMSPANNLYALGSFTSKTYKTTKDLGEVPQKLERALSLAENPDIVPVDVSVEAGLGTIWTTAAHPSMSGSAATGYFYDDTKYIDLSADGLINTSGNAPDSFMYDGFATIGQIFTTFAETTRKDHLFVSDPLRHIFVNGPDSKVVKNKNFVYSRDIYWSLRNLYADINSSYTASYGNWGKAYDSNTDKYCWVPLSGNVASAMAKSDAQNYKWTPVGGLTRGIITGIVELAITPNQKQRDLLYRAGINPIAFFPSDGFAIMGQKTLLRRPSAFNRINVRRLFIDLEKATQAVLKYFVMEPNTVFTRTRCRNTLAPIFDIARTNSGIYDYMIVCDDRNNTGDVIDRDELQVDIYLKPVRAGEFVLVNFIATRTSQNFSELL